MYRDFTVGCVCLDLVSLFRRWALVAVGAAGFAVSFTETFGEQLNVVNNPEFEVTVINPSGTEWAAEREDTPATTENPRYTVNDTNAINVGWYNTGRGVIEVWTPSFQNGQLGGNLGSSVSEINSVDGNSQLYISFTADYTFDYDFSWYDVNRPGGTGDYRVNINTGLTPIGATGTGNTFTDDFTSTVSVFNQRTDTVTLERGETYTLSYSTNFSSTLSSLIGEVYLVTPVDFVYWDTNGTTPGSGGPSPNGTWNGSNSNWSDASDGTGPLATFANDDVAVFSAGTDATGSYTVTKAGRTDVNGIVFEDGTPTIAHGSSGRIHFDGTNGGVPFVEVASGVTATIETRVTDQGSEGLVKFGDGTLILGGSRSNSRIDGLTVEAGTVELANTAENRQIRQSVTINGGTLLVSEANQIDNNATVVLNGGTFAIGETTEVVDTLTLDSDSTIDFVGSNGILTFDDSSGVGWDNASTLTISNWNGQLSGGGSDQLSFGAGGLDPNQVAQIRFFNPAGLPSGVYGARILGSGEVVPVVPEPGTWLMGGVACFAAFIHLWRRRIRISSASYA
ncbi:MAG: hypothetical protein AAFX93_12315 [Verrucomicrobiota bacterium]